jgi:hypothetical protein
MVLKKILFHVLVRIAILLLLLGSLFLIWSFAYDPHKNCEGDMHRHVDGGLGLFILGFLIIQMYCIGLFAEMIYLFIKKRKKSAFANLGILTILAFITATFMFGIS